MKKLFAFVFASLFLVAGCAKDDDILPQQQKNIVSFLTSKHVPKLIYEDQIAEQGELPYYSTSGNSVYRYIADAWNPDRQEKALVAGNSRVTITYRAYVFAYTTISDILSAASLPFDSNDPAVGAEMIAEWGLTPGAWSFVPYTVHLGKDEILNGLRLALIGCREGDEVEAYMTYNMVYGSKYMSVVPRDTPVAFLFTIDNVE